MFEIIFFLVALTGSGLAGIIDLKTTEIPDKIPYIMIILGIIGHSLISGILWDINPLILSLVIGSIFLGFGFLMYFAGQWGGGDAKILGAIGFLLPSFELKNILFPFPVSFFFNVFLVGAIYMIIYIFILSLIRKDIWIYLFKYFRKNYKKIIKYNLIFILSAFIFGIYTFYAYAYPLFLILRFGFFIIIGTLGFFLFWKFAKTVENVGFKKKIPVSELKEGDVLESSKIWEGITKKELKKIKASKKKYVKIKDGVRFAPAFPLALLFTYFYGDAIFWILNYYLGI